MKKRAALQTLCIGLATGLLCTTATAQSWPKAKPITLIVSYAAGGDTDVSARIYAEKLSAALGQAVVVENKPGAGGMIGNSFVAKAKADGYTLLYANSTLPIVQHVLKASPAVAYNPERDFTPIIRDQNIPLILMTSPNSGFADVKTLVAAAKGGKKISYGSPSVGTPMHIAAEVFNKEAGIKMRHAPYKGSAPAIADLLGNHVDAIWVTPGTVVGHIKERKLVPLATAEAKRSSLLPQVPTFNELGYPAVRLSAWQGMLGPRNLPADVVATLNKHMNDIIRMPDVQAKLASLGIEPVGGTPAEFGKLIADDDKRFGALVKEFGIHAD